MLFLRDGRIQALLPWQEGERFLHQQKGYRDLRGKLLLPGFVDAHVHYPQTEMIGAFGEQLLEWLTTYTFRWRASLPMPTTPRRSRSFLSTSC